MRRLLDRRHFLRLGTVALGSTLLVGRARADARRASACILLYMDGGPSHLDLWDLKPQAPAEVRGPFRPIATSVPGIRVCEHLPRVAAQMHHIAQLRGVRHQASVHDPAVYQMLTGRSHPSTAGGLTVQPSDFPQVGTVYGKLQRDAPSPLPLSPEGRGVRGLPRVIELPETMRMEARILPGQNAGFLGTSWDPFRVQVTPDADVVPPELGLAADVTTRRLAGRRTLLEQLNARRADLELRAEAAELDEFQQQALDLLARPQLGAAFALDRERPALRDRYGRHRHGQSVLLARRLVEAGAGFVTVYWGREPQDWADGRGPRPANNPWDTHRNHFPLLRDDLLPRADQALAALLDDLDQRGLLSSTLVVWMGDFGRTPRIDRRWASRDHWPHANTVLLAGAGVPGGLVHGRTDNIAAEVIEDAVTPADVTATMLHLLGVDTRGTLRDHQGRPHTITEGTPIRALVT